MYYEVQQVVALIRDAAALHAGACAPAAAASAALAARLPARLQALTAQLDLADAPRELVPALRSGAAAGPEAHCWLPLAVQWLKAVLARA